MKRFLLFLTAFLPFIAQAQIVPETAPDVKSDNVPVVKFGYLSYETALKSMTDYATAQQKLEEQRAAYEKEMQRVEDDFNQKYESFLEGQKDFPRTILLKRQNELQELMQRNIEFKTKARQELKDAETEAMKPLKTKLNEALANVARKHGLALVINTDANACPFIDPTMGVDLQEEVAKLLK